MGVRQERVMNQYSLTQKHEANTQDTRTPFIQGYAWALASAFGGLDMA
jgi:hypothetical protein